MYIYIYIYMYICINIYIHVYILNNQAHYCYKTKIFLVDATCFNIYEMILTFFDTLYILNYI